jgi:fructose-specific phosphotransferase system IIA component
MKISQVISQNKIQIINSIDSKKELIENLITLAGNDGSIKDAGQATSDVIARENVMSTGVGKGIALPHAKTDHIFSTSASLILLNNSIDYNALDGEPVRLCILLLSKTENISLHLKMLSHFSRLLNNESMRNKIMECNSPNQIFQEINYFEKLTA